MEVRRAPAPSGPLYRLGRLPDPLAWPEWRYVGGGRFDDPAAEFRVLYAAERRLACLVETLARFRPDLELLARMGRVEGSDESMLPGEIPADWLASRLIGRLQLGMEQAWLDLRAPETIQALRRELAEDLVRLDLDDFDIGDARGRSRDLTRRIARWAFEHGFRGIAYRSRFGDELDCWAIFEGAAFEHLPSPEPIFTNDPDLLEAARLLGLIVTA